MRLLIITPHLSTGGLPQYLLAKLRHLVTGCDVSLVEYQCASQDYVVQRRQIIQLLPTLSFVSLGEDKSQLVRLVQSIRPDVIHWEEIPELFCDISIAREIYSKPDRDYLLVESTHTSGFDIQRKLFLPDKFWWVSEFSRRQYRPLGVPGAVLEYPIEAKKRPDRNAALNVLGLNPASKHVLNVGLFTPGKDQAAAFRIAERCVDRPVVFHFVGNLAPNFDGYWRPLLPAPKNCRIWGEREDVDSFYAACDAFLFTSQAELNPIVLKEAAAWGMPILMRDLPTYCGRFREGSTLRFLTGNTDHDARLVMEVTA